MIFCLKCHNPKLEMDMHDSKICKICYIKAENDFWSRNSFKSKQTRKEREKFIEGLIKNIN